MCTATACCFAITLVALGVYFTMGKGTKKKSTNSQYEDDFPATLEGFGYKFDKAGCMRSIEKGHPFRFEVKSGDHDYNQKHYEALGKAVEEHVYMLLENQEGLERVIIPVDALQEEPKSMIFVSKDLNKYEKLLILIHGSGVVRAGQWTRNHMICMFSMFTISTIGGGPCLLQAAYRSPESPEKHFIYVWDKIIMPTAAKHIAIMAHSYGGMVVVDGLIQRPGEMMKRVFAVPMSDSVHGIIRMEKSQCGKTATKWFREHSRNWVSSQKPIDTHVDSPNSIDACRVSAGTTSHIETSWYAFESVFKFLQEKLDQRLGAEVRAKGNQVAAAVPEASAPLPEDTKIAESPAPNKIPEAAPVQEEEPMSQDPETELMETETVHDGGAADRGVTMAARQDSGKEPVEHQEESQDEGPTTSSNLKQPLKAKSEL
eukprot:Seg72.3 transcript_id=Seg72.3/GoldUCD/mRNA.D3Y31 product="UPF0528 protein" protein_id=Seg72.3/GoldUCD/D3Y31